ARGRLTSIAEPFYAGSIDNLTAPAPGTPLHQFAYDALDRRVRQTLPTGGTRSTAYAALSDTETVTDLAPVTHRFDGLGRIVHTERTVSGALEQVDATYDAESR